METDFLKLMIPGPIQPDPAVLEAMGRPVQAHYGPAWLKVYGGTIDLLKQVFNTKGDVFIMPGSGSAAVDACIGSALSTGEKCLVGSNGFFGERLEAIARGYGLQAVPVVAEWGQPLRATDFAAAFRSHPDAKAVIVVHLETSTTVVNPVEEISQVAHQNGAVMIVDAVSSLGGVPLEMDAWGIDLCASASQKCLGAPPGVAPVAVSPRGWEFIDRNPNKAHGWYSDLRIWRWYVQEWGDWHPSPVTMPVNNIVALRESLDQLLAEGIPQRLERYRRLALRLRAGLRSVGMSPFTPDDRMAPVLTAAYAPEGIPSGQIVSYLEKECHIKISGGLGALKERLFRIGHMSPVLTGTDIDEVIDALRAFQAENVPANGQGVHR